MKRRDRSNLPEGDDGRTIVPMDVDGMPGFFRREDRPVTPNGDDGLTPEQRRAYRFAAVRAALAVALIFGAVFALFIAFCDFVWFRR